MYSRRTDGRVRWVIPPRDDDSTSTTSPSQTVQYQLETEERLQRCNQLVPLPEREQDHAALKKLLTELRSRKKPNRHKPVQDVLENDLEVVFYSSDGAGQEEYVLPKGTVVLRDYQDHHMRFVVDVEGMYRLTLGTLGKNSVVTIIRRLYYNSDAQRPCTEPKGYGPRAFGSVN